ncbi:hypothetical protein DFH05DRAFT_1463433 [Lentinula detonsa]|uniref:Uncharacterized protein n=1 Tax=Lentinula detonsa TaxID=2804962 RepID=A0A9W8TTU8_9AGAR|nr:hypothetical protein DFH05DRAFT_1463433 [Lentinula detonsa]
MSKQILFEFGASEQRMLCFEAMQIAKLAGRLHSLNGRVDVAEGICDTSAEPVDGGSNERMNAIFERSGLADLDIAMRAFSAMELLYRCARPARAVGAPDRSHTPVFARSRIDFATCPQASSEIICLITECILAPNVKAFLVGETFLGQASILLLHKNTNILSLICGRRRFKYFPEKSREIPSLPCATTHLAVLLVVELSHLSHQRGPRFKT